jgi:long-chain acyl-CoA synthetase
VLAHQLPGWQTAYMILIYDPSALIGRCNHVEHRFSRSSLCIPCKVRTHLASIVQNFRAHATETAVVSHHGVRRYVTSYGDLAQLAGRFAAELERRGIRPGERVVLWGENSAEWIGAFFGCLLRGVLAVPLDAAGSTDFAHRVLDEVTPRLILGDTALLRGMETKVPKIVFSEMVAALPVEANITVDAFVQEDTPFQIVFTSGTTSEPKGIVHTHRNVLASLRPIEAEMAKYRKYERWVHPLRFLHTLPLSHVFGQFMGLWVPALLAAELHFADGLEPARMIDLIRRNGISVLVAVPRVLGLLRAHLLRSFPSLIPRLERAGGLSILKRWWQFRDVHQAFGWKFWAVISGGASLPLELERFWNQLGFALIQGYGMTETAALVTLNHPFRIGQGTIGKALPGREVRLSGSGEILVRGDVVSGATWQHGRMQRREGEWLATGDLAEQTDSGDFHFIGRKGDAIVTSSGLNIYPSDLESAMLRQPGIRGCAVVPCEIASSIEPVCVVLFSGEDAALQQAVRDANEGLTEYQQIRRILRWPEVEFPYTSTGKLLRRKIRDWACAALQDGTGSPSGQRDALISLIAEITGVEGRQGGDDLRLSEDFYLDSLGRVQLASAIEQRMGIELGEEQIASIATLGDLRKALREREPSGALLTGTVPVAAESQPPKRQATAESHIYPRWPWSWPVRVIRTVMLEVLVRPLIGLLLGPRVVKRNEGILTRPLLIIANHVTALDGLLVLYGLPARLRRCVAIAMSGEMLLDFRSGRGQGSFVGNLFAPVAYWLVTALFNVFPLPRLQGFRRSFAHAGEALDRGYSVLIFPEGMRSQGEEMGTFRQGIGLLAAGSGVPVLPVALVGLGALRSRKVKWFHSGLLEIRIGDMVTMPEGTTPADWTAKLELVMQQLSI